MRLRGYQRSEDSTYELNLAPMLDIIVSIVPMLLLSVVFVRITMIETPVPQVVEQAIAAANEKNKDVIVTLGIAKGEGFRLTVVNPTTGDGQPKDIAVPLKDGQLDFDALYKEAATLKRSLPTVFKIELAPGADVPMTDIVRSMDSVRQFARTDGEITFNDVNTGKPVTTNLMFPEITFGNITGG